MTIRQAKKQDSKQAAVLIYDAIHDIAHALTGETEREKVYEQLEKYFCQEHNRISYRNCFVKTIEDEVVGLVLAYHGEDALALDEPIVRHLKENHADQEIRIDPETDKEDYYIDTVSVNAAFCGRGFGTELLQTIMQHAKGQGYPSVSLNVEENNANARRLYERLGFEKKKDILINGHVFSYLVKKLV